MSTAALSPSGQSGLSTKSGPISVFRIELACLLCGRAIGTLETSLGPVDVLVNNAGWDQLELFVENDPPRTGVTPFGSKPTYWGREIDDGADTGGLPYTP